LSWKILVDYGSVKQGAIQINLALMYRAIDVPQNTPLCEVSVSRSTIGLLGGFCYNSEVTDEYKKQAIS
jgi:hypothetical protein